MIKNNKNNLIETYEVREKGFHPLLIRDNWQVAKLNYLEDRKGHDKRYSLNFDKISKLGFKCRRSIRDSKEWDEMVQYYKEYQKA